MKAKHNKKEQIDVWNLIKIYNKIRLQMHNKHDSIYLRDEFLIF